MYTSYHYAIKNIGYHDHLKEDRHVRCAGDIFL